MMTKDKTAASFIQVNIFQVSTDVFHDLILVYTTYINRANTSIFLTKIDIFAFNELIYYTFKV